MGVSDTIKAEFTEKKQDVVGLFLVTGIVILSAVAWFQIIRVGKNIAEEAVDAATGG